MRRIVDSAKRFPSRAELVDDRRNGKMRDAHGSVPLGASESARMLTVSDRFDRMRLRLLAALDDEREGDSERDDRRNSGSDREARSRRRDALAHANEIVDVGATLRARLEERGDFIEAVGRQRSVDVLRQCRVDLRMRRFAAGERVAKYVQCAELFVLVAIQLKSPFIKTFEAA